MNARSHTCIAPRAGLVIVAVAAALAGCASTSDTIEELQIARSVVPQVEASPRAGVAASNVSEARKELDLANRAAQTGNEGDVRYHANVAATHAQIANEKILTAQAQEALEKSTAERERVLADARTREADAARQRAAMLEEQTESLQQHARTLEQQLQELQAKPTDRGMVVTLGDVLFDTGKAQLKPGAQSTMDRLATILKEDKSRVVVIEGHTDSVGSDHYNQGLSEQRALAVQSALMQRGVQGAQIQTEGKGENMPVASNDNPAGRQQNRRVEVIFATAKSRVATDTN